MLPFFSSTRSVLGRVGAAALGLLFVGTDAGATSPPPPPPWTIEALAPTPFARGYRESPFDLEKPVGPMSLPANVPSFGAIGGYSDRPLPPVRLLDVSENPPRELPLRVERPADGELGGWYHSIVLPPVKVSAGDVEQSRPLLVAGRTYRLETSTACEECRESVDLAFDFEATPAAPLPSTAGELVAPVLRLNDDLSRERQQPGYDVDFTFAISRELLPWKHAYKFEVLLDDEIGVDADVGGRLLNDVGRPWVASLVEGASLRRVVRCEQFFAGVPPLTREPHKLQLVAYSLGFEAPTLVTNELEIFLDCTAAVPPPLPKEQGAAGSPPAPPASPPTEPEESDEGCSVAAPGAPAPAAFALSGLGALAAMLVGSRRRRGRERKAGARTRANGNSS